ncbi:aminotransferase class V-fold PLP-dependent enzyme [Pseudomonas neustonica]|uniref:aminotransferase class V-fold PLP-dependent enzyme n=1 Tax=Pseudomonas neustonica TaxID=2487346 RepID=UPI003F44E33F|tara:strand:- start:2191 stop:3357 length:1167 start_codon:yes stop_codon:yes gene_type:complete
MTTPYDWQHEFPLDPDICYLNHAAVAPWPKRAADAVSRFAQENARQGARDYPRWAKQETHLRQQLKQLVNAPSVDDIALVKNTSEALSFVAHGINWQAGDEIITSDQEFPSNRIPWEALSSRGVNVRQISLQGDDPEQALIDAMNENTRLLTISSVQYASGLRMDLKRLGAACRTRKILFCVDAIQTIGALPFDVQSIDCDFAMADGHKWLLGPEGLGVFYCRESVRDQLQLTQHGWHMVEAMGNYDLKQWQPASSARRFEAGSPNTLAQHALSASLELLLDTGMDRVGALLQQRVTYLITALQQTPGVRLLSPEAPERRAGIVTFAIEGVDHPRLHRELMQSGIICAQRGGGIRWSPHFYMTEDTLDQAVSQLQLLISQQGDNSGSR